MMVSQQWPQDFLNESETTKDNSLINNQSKAYMWSKKNDKRYKTKDAFSAMTICNSFKLYVNLVYQQEPPLTGKKLSHDCPSLFKASSLWRSAFPNASRYAGLSVSNKEYTVSW